MSVFQWTEKYSVHVELFDRQHRILFRTSEELHEALHKGQGKVVVGKIMQRLIDSATTHFADEDVALALKAHPDFRRHRDEHKALLNQLLNFQREYQAGTLGVAARMKPFLQRWLSDHIMLMDKQYETLFTEEENVTALVKSKSTAGGAR
jgi:hemerythrin